MRTGWWRSRPSPAGTGDTHGAAEPFWHRAGDRGGSAPSAAARANAGSCSGSSAVRTGWSRWPRSTTGCGQRSTRSPARPGALPRCPMPPRSCASRGSRPWLRPGWLNCASRVSREAKRCIICSRYGFGIGIRAEIALARGHRERLPGHVPGWARPVYGSGGQSIRVPVWVPDACPGRGCCVAPDGAEWRSGPLQGLLGDGLAGAVVTTVAAATGTTVSASGLQEAEEHVGSH